ncbi:Rne/Rng family ribonuclease [Tropicimonas marinistellae]|uniref:Rne/Rng family ribonuclease n=1 Tax=Tropicimonas marinistellae TaxID=1739787 RepID=UPI000832ECB6|nr:ribonuclease E/G [Tropicimonas marinistellae]
MAKKMLIDATHAEETRVVVVDGNKVDEFDFETVNKRQLAGNIYLAKVTRVEPSLQAAFVDYGGNRHGFLAFSEIHPDYYQIPVADREALLAEEAAMAKAEDDEESDEPKKSRSRSRRRSSRSRDKAKTDETKVADSDGEADEKSAGDTLNGVEGMDVVEFDDESGDDATEPVSVIEDGVPAAEDDTNGAVPETADDTPVADEEPSEAVSAASDESDTTDGAEVAQSAGAVGEPDTDVEDAGESSQDGEQPTESPDVAGETEHESGDDEKTRSGGTMAARVEDDPDDVLSSGEVDAEGNATPEDTADAEVPTEVDAAEAPAEPADVGDDSEESPAPVAEAADEAADDATTDDEPSLSDDGADAAADDSPEETGDGAAQPAVAEEESAAETVTDESADGETPESEADDTTSDDEDNGADHPGHDIESVAEEDVQEEIQRPRKPRMRRYKIQEVIKVRQIMLVQVVKEERGNKGAALTTYLSLAGRYCVLMPNTARGGGISRKITNASDRKKLKEIASEIEVPEGAGLIIRTAGAKRTKSEIKRDYEYLKRLWEQIRELTLKSIAPAPIYEEGNLIKRSIRDLYNRDIDEVLVEGEGGYRVAKDFMKMIMPSHAKNVKHYTDSMPLFARYQVESYLAGMFNPTVQLKSGGYIVIGVTEALVAIDVNSGRATKEGSIEETALKTNLEAAEEVARQLRLRDLAGLIVIDFIDMEERRNNTAVEKRFKEKLKTDRARIQVGRISGFGLLEMSRQRLRPGMLEATTQPCPHCHGTGLLRSSDSIGLQILRQLEEEGGRRRSREVLVKVPPSICNFLINQKREHIAHIEAQYGLSVRIESDPSLIPPDFSIEKFKTATRVVPEPSAAVISVDTSDMPEIVDAEEEEETGQAAQTESSDEDAPKKKRRRRRRRRGSSSSQEGGDTQPESDATSADGAESQDDQSEAGDTTAESETTADGEEQTKSSRSRRRRRSRSRSRDAEDTPEAATENPDTVQAESDADGASPETNGDDDVPVFVGGDVTEPAQDTPETPAEAQDVVPDVAEDAAEPASAPEQTSETLEAAEVGAAEAEDTPSPDMGAAPEGEEAAGAEVSTSEAESDAAEPAELVEAEAAMAEASPEPAADEPPKPKRRGWWSVGR